MKRLLVILLVCLAAPAAAYARPIDKSDGTLTITNGRGVVVVGGRGTVLGRIGSGSISVLDLTPNDASSPYVYGYDQAQSDPGSSVVTYRGAGMRFRIVGGGYRIVVAGRGIDIVAVGQGTLRFPATSAVTDGRFSLDGAAFQDVPDGPFTGTFGGTSSSGG